MGVTTPPTRNQLADSVLAIPTGECAVFKGWNIFKGYQYGVV